MPDITITCPHCAMTMQLKSEWKGMNMRCPGCQMDIIIPDVTPLPPPQPPKKQSQKKTTAGWMQIVWMAACLLLILIGFAVLVRSIHLAVRLDGAQSEKNIIADEQKMLTEYRFSSKYSPAEYTNRRIALDKKIDKWQRNYTDLDEIINMQPRKLFITGIVIFLAGVLPAAIDYVVFSLSYGSLGKTRCPISQSGIIRLLQIVDGTLAAFFFFAVFTIDLLFLIPAIWFACTTVALNFPEKLGGDIDKNASLAEDATGLLILPLKAALSLICLPFIAGEIVLIINLFRHDFIEFTNDMTIMLLVALLPLAHYIFFLYSTYFLEIGLSIVAIPKLLKKQLEK